MSAGENVHLAPIGRPEQANVTSPCAPFSDVTETVVAEEADPRLTLNDATELLTVNDDNPNGAGVRFLVEGAGMPGNAASYQRLVLLFDGEDPEAVETARARWSEAKSAGFDVTYWQTDDKGRWQRQA